MDGLFLSSDRPFTSSDQQWYAAMQLRAWRKGRPYLAVSWLGAVTNAMEKVSAGRAILLSCLARGTTCRVFHPVCEDFAQSVDLQIYRGNKTLPLALGKINRILLNPDRIWLGIVYQYLGSKWHQQVDRKCSKASNENLPHQQLRVRASNYPYNPALHFFSLTSAKCHPISVVKKTMRRSEMLINNRWKHQLSCLDRSGSQVQLFTSPQGPPVIPIQQSSPGRPGKQVWLDRDMGNA